MKQLLILSGKGGTGKTTVASAFIKLAKAEVYADCDVDAPNLHLVTVQNEEPKRSDYVGMPKASINAALCTSCDRCRQSCRFEAISKNSVYHVDPFSCEGCGVCEAVCPAGAITMEAAVAGELMLYSGGDKVFSTAQLKMGSGTSGKLVTEVKRQMKEAVGTADIAIIDGSPGIGCPVIASISGVYLVLVVAEPTISGISDMERIIKTAKTFQTRIAVCINKYDINLENTEKIEAFCTTNGLPFVGKIPYDAQAVKAINGGKTIVDIDCAAGSAVSAVYQRVAALLCM